MPKNAAADTGRASVNSATAPSLPGEDDSLRLLRDFARESRLTVKKPIQPRFGNRYIARRSLD